MPVRAQHGSQDLSLNGFDQDFNFGRAARLVTVYMHASVPITESIALKYKSSKGSDYDTLIDGKILNNGSDYMYAAEGTIAINELESINIAVTNANLTGSVFVTVKADY